MLSTVVVASCSEAVSPPLDLHGTISENREQISNQNSARSSLTVTRIITVKRAEEHLAKYGVDSKPSSVFYSHCGSEAQSPIMP